MNGRIISLILALKGKCELTDEQIRERVALSPSEYHCLIAVGPSVRLSAAALSEKMGLSASRGSRVIDNMVKKGYLRSESVDGDRRKVALSLSEKGIDAKRQIDAVMQECATKIESKISSTELGKIEDSLEKLLSVL